MESKALYTWVQGVFSIEQPCMAMSLLSSLSIRNQDFCLHALVDPGRRVQDQVERKVRKNRASMLTLLCPYSI